MRAGFRYGLIGLAAVAAGTGLWWGLGHPLPEGAAGALPGPVAQLLAPQAPPKTRAKTRAPEAPDFDVAVARAAPETVPVAFAYTGTVISPKDAALQPRVTGVVVERPFEPGGHVKQGQVLFRIDPRPFEVALRTAEAQREQAVAQLAFADAEVDRTQPLADKGYASEQRFQQLESNRQVARSRVQEAEAAIARQRLNLDYAVIRAPFDGRSSLSDVNVGDHVNENATQLVSVVQVDPIEIQVALSAEDSEAVRAALKENRAFLQALDVQGKPERKATIYKLDNRFDPRTARRLVRAWLPNADERYLPGEFVRTQVQVGTEERLLVPTVALSAQLDQRIVWRVGEDGTVAMAPVETGEEFGDRTAILKGLKAGDRIATDHLQLLRQGQRVGIRQDGKDARQAANEPGEAVR
ncbi:efflux RND transporter periplasmic adaptor subunit [Methylobacterium nonmethylotrophicum]|uniref:Efflux RND transporter periplasmic adaptor subunit n=1 Tax=Methylobacterium nonmethylotrophicum TaxID=1141884 RepID=A0A4Z0NQ85_9HYPH|nr:efflux RND transporter periplasmic adaptor subunit [Methylobacterium nonmethylotrophicum]TGD97950.1 efflux RND transporter periplasmic adaptor subunit [Methylobacterium nonmethylotrophicum]